MNIFAYDPGLAVSLLFIGASKDLFCSFLDDKGGDLPGFDAFYSCYKTRTLGVSGTGVPSFESMLSSSPDVFQIGLANLSLGIISVAKLVLPPN